MASLVAAMLIMGLTVPVQAQNLVTNGYANFGENPPQGWTDVSGDIGAGKFNQLDPRTTAGPDYSLTGRTSTEVEHIANRNFEGENNTPPNWSTPAPLSGDEALISAAISEFAVFSGTKEGTDALDGGSGAGNGGVYTAEATQVIDGIPEGRLHDFSLWGANNNSTDDLNVAAALISLTADPASTTSSPTVPTKSPSSITPDAADLGGDVTENGGASVSDRGVHDGSYTSA